MLIHNISSQYLLLTTAKFNCHKKCLNAVLSDLGAVAPRVDVSIVQGFQNQISHIRQISLKVKVNCAIPHEECRQRAHLPSLGHEPDETLMSVAHGQCDANVMVTFPAA